LEDTGIDGSIISWWSLSKHCDRVLNGFIWLRIGCTGFCVPGIEPSCSMKGRGFDKLNNCQLLKK
jgi:hypothetical protein